MNAADLANKLGDARREPNGWRCRCPAHEDHNPSLAISERGGKILVNCRAGCDQAAVIAALRERDLWSNPADEDQNSSIGAVYSYRDENGALRYQVVRLYPKKFFQRRPNGAPDAFINSVRGIAPLPYRLPDLLADPDATIYVAEGEKDCDNLAEIGIVATCNNGGAGKWRPEISRWLAGRNVVLIPDNDDAGRAHVRDVAQKLAGIAESIRILDLPGLPAKGDVSDWLAAGGTADQLDRLAALAPIDADENHRDGRRNPEITIVAGERHKAADQGLDALHAARVPFYQRDRSLVRVCNVKARSISGDVILVPGIAVVTPAILDRALGQVAHWQRFDPNEQELRTIDPPRLVVSQILDMVGEWPFEPLAGVIGCPTLRPDGSILAQEGYDQATGLVLRSAVSMPRISESPTRRDAEAAVSLLAALLAEFPFGDDASMAVALSMILTPVLRGAMPAAPMHLVTAPQPGTGKSYLADTASMIATGERVAAIAVAPNPEETEKRLIGCALAGFPVIGLDNCRDTLSGDFLCQVTERPLLQLRALGKSDKIRVANTFTTFANGNNVTVADDLVRRTIWCALDADMESPETRTFHGDPIAAVRNNRGAYIAACLTIARAYIAAGKPDRLPPLASYEGWSDIVRSPLVWLGYADPVATMAAARDADPVRQERARFFVAWRSELGIDQDYLVAEIIDLATARYSYDNSLTRPLVYAGLIDAAQKRGAPAGQIEPRRLGKWLSRHENTIAAGLKLTVDRSDRSRIRYRLRETAR